MKTLLSVLGICLSLQIFAQPIEEDINVVYMKADVLMQSERYDEAIRVYNQIIREQADFKQALFQRAKAKYALGAFQGTKNDLLQHIDLKGLDKQIIHWLGKTEFGLKNYQQSRSYFNVALEMDEYDAELYLYRAEVNLALDDQNNACEDFSKAALLGNRKAKTRMESQCFEWEKPSKPKYDKEPYYGDNNEQNESTYDEPDEDDLITRIPDYPHDNDEYETENPQEDLDISQEFVIDEGLSLVIGNGLGARKVESVPDIFILSESSGRVVLDLCVNGAGEVTEATFNRDYSTIFKTNLNSLAMRKAKELVFLPSFRENQCGTITYLIKG